MIARPFGEATVARQLSPAQSILLGTGSDLLKKTTIFFFNTIVLHYVGLNIMSGENSLVPAFPVAS